MAEFIKNFIKSQDQWDLLHTTILTVLKHDCFDDEALDIDPVVCVYINVDPVICVHC